MRNISVIEIIDGVHVDITERFFCEPEPKRPLPLDTRLKVVLRAHGATRCTCGHRIGWGDIAWNSGNTEYGTGFCTVQIQCVGCDREIVNFHSWYPGITDRDELLYVLETDWGKR